MKDWAFLGHHSVIVVPSGLSLPPAQGSGGSGVTTRGWEGQCSDPRSSHCETGHSTAQQETLVGTQAALIKTPHTPRNSATRDRLFYKPASISSLNLYNFQFWVKEPPSVQTFHLCIPTSYSVPYLQSDCAGFHEQNLYCLGISAVYFGRDISICMSYTQSSIRSCIDFSLQAYIYIFDEKLTRVSKNCLHIKLITLLPSASAFYFFPQNETTPRVFWQKIRNSMYAEVICLIIHGKGTTTLSVSSARFSIACNIPFFIIFFWELFQYLNHQEKSFLLQKALKNKNTVLSLPVEIGIFRLTQIIPH